jgi:mRNA-degrading endonuclease RelE of RelBE toxin-antitoxin system
MMKLLLDPVVVDSDLQSLPKDVYGRILKKLAWYAGQANPLWFAKTLTDLPPATHRFRIGDYRALFLVQDQDTIYVLKIVHRKKAYQR